ncbi:MAG: hypothetical protein KJ725_16415 [Gammaproteobacteria bacterium]|nr:hypothetical protein [Gammaproteobacteria bacterium]
MRILWVEDQHSEQKQALWFGDLAQCKIEVIKDYAQAHECISKHMQRFDLIVLDINLEDSALTELITQSAQAFALAPHDFLREAGFHLYVQLLEQGYDKERIVFFTGNVNETPLQRAAWAFRQAWYQKPSTQEEKQVRPEKLKELFKEIQRIISKQDAEALISLRNSGNDPGFWQLLNQLAEAGDNANNTYNVFKRRFKEARMTPPHAIRKSTDEQTRDDLALWLSPHLHNPYLRLRDALVSMTEHINDQLHDDDQILFNQYIPDTGQQFSQADLRAYFHQLAALLPQREPNDEEKQRIYQQLLRSLVHEWDDKAKNARYPDWPLASVLRRLRNWLAHGKTPDTIEESLLTYLFWLNSRSMFNFASNELQPVEYALLMLFNRQETERLQPALVAAPIVNQHKHALKKLIKHFNHQRPNAEINDTRYQDRNGHERPIKTFADLASAAQRNGEFIEQHNQWLWGSTLALFWEACEKLLPTLNSESHYLNAMAHCFWAISQGHDA